MKKLIKILMVLLVLVIIAVVGLTLALPSLINLEKVRILAEEKATEALGRQVSISDTSFALWGGPRVKLLGLSIAEVEGFGDEPFAKLNSFDLSVRFWPLLKRKIEVDHIIIVQPRFRIIRNRKGAWNWADMISEIEASESIDDGKSRKTRIKREKGKPDSGPSLVLAKDIRVSDGEIYFRNETLDLLEKGLNIKGVNLEVKFPSLQRPISIKASAGLDRSKADVVLGGTIGPLGTSFKPNRVPFDLRLDIPGFELGRIEGLVGALPYKIEGMVRSEKTIRGSVSDGVEFDHLFSFDNLRLASQDGSPIISNISGRVAQKGFFEKEKRAIRFDELAAELDRAKVNVSGTVLGFGEDAVVDLELASKPIPLDGWHKIFPSLGFSEELSGNLSVKGKVSGSYNNGFLAILDHIVLASPNLRLTRNKEGIWNYTVMLAKSGLAKSGAQAASGKGSGKGSASGGGAVRSRPVPIDMLVKDIRVSDGVVFFQDETNDRLKKGLSIMGINLDMKNVSLDKPISITASAGLQRPEADITFTGTLGPIGKKPDPERIPFNLTQNFPGFELARIEGLAGPLPVKLSGRVKSKRSVKGSIAKGVEFDQVSSLAGLNVISKDGSHLVKGFSGTTTQRGFVNIKKKSVNLSEFTLELDRAKLYATGTVSNPGPNAVLNLKLNSDPIPLDSWDKIFPSLGSIARLAGDLSISGKMKGKYGKDLMATVDFKSSNFELDRGPALLEAGKADTPAEETAGIKAGQAFKPIKPSPVSFNGKVFISKGRFEKVDYSNLAAVMTFKGTKFNLDRMGFSAFGGNLAGSAWADLGVAPLAYGSTMKMNKVQINDAVSAFTKLGGMIYGKATSDVKISGRGTVFEEVKKSLSGGGTMDVGEGRLTNTNLLKGAGVAASLLQLGSGKDETQFDAVKAAFTIKDERVKVSSAVISTADWELTASGYIGLDRSLNMKSRMALSGKLASVIPQNKRDLFPIDNLGRLQIPMKIGGTVTSPRFALDTAVMAEAAGEAAKKRVEKKIQKRQDELKKKLEKDIGDSLKKLFR